MDAQAQRRQADLAAKAARAALAAVLAERAQVLDETDAAIARLIDAAITRILAQLAAAPTDYQLWVLPRLMDGVRRVADDLAAQVAARSNTAMRAAWELGERAVAAPLVAEATAASAVPAGLVATAAPVASAAAVPWGGLGQPSLAQLRATQAFTTELITGATADAVRTVNRALGQVVLGVQSPHQAMQQVAAVLPDKTATQVRGIVASQLASAYNTASHAELVRRAALDPNLRKQWRRSGKLHSRANHDAVDGQVQPVTKPFEVVSGAKKAGGQVVLIMYPGDPAAPLGETINCGCVALAWKATWKMKNPGATAMTAAQIAARDAPRKRPAAAKAAPPTTPQARALAAFRGGLGALYKDVTGQPVRVDATLYPPTLGDARLVRSGRDTTSYWAVQGLKRPTEVWEQQAVNMGSGEIERTRLMIKRFESGGQQWVGQVRTRWDGAAWLPTAAWQAQPAGAKTAADVAMSRLRAGVRVWPRR